ncbi:unnamed protein product [Ceutorhynchus assimilis]|uniref:Uncharacterized protein n=1 Tax=Ceutorhynchus assimilis TaxID=467358 RepID=A0A9N9N0Z7_9CUCU|nr:unnamed protein product [Ceutorhynchus assimilis]
MRFVTVKVLSGNPETSCGITFEKKNDEREDMALIDIQDWLWKFFYINQEAILTKLVV